MSEKGRREIEREIIDRAMKDEEFRDELLKNPRRVLERETGVSIPRNLKVKVVQEGPDVTYLVLPSLPPQGQKISDDELQKAAGTIQANTWDGMCYTDSGYFTCNPNEGCAPRRIVR